MQLARQLKDCVNDFMDRLIEARLEITQLQLRERELLRAKEAVEVFAARTMARAEEAEASLAACQKLLDGRG